MSLNCPPSNLPTDTFLFLAFCSHHAHVSQHLVMCSNIGIWWGKPCPVGQMVPRCKSTTPLATS